MSTWGLQYARVYANGKMVTRTDVPGQTPIFTLVLPVVAGTKYLIVLNGDQGDPYGGYRGHPGVRWMPLPQPLVQHRRVCVSRKLAIASPEWVQAACAARVDVCQSRTVGFTLKG